MQMLKTLYPNTVLLRTDPKKAESLFKDHYGMRRVDSKEQFDVKMNKLEKNSTVFNHARGVDKMTSDHRAVFHNIFKVGSLSATVTITDIDEAPRGGDPRQSR